MSCEPFEMTSKVVILCLIAAGCSLTQTPAPDQAVTQSHASETEGIPSPSYTNSPSPTSTPYAVSSITPSPPWTATPVPTLPPGVVNHVRVDAFNSYDYHSVGQFFINHEVYGLFSTAIHVQNTSDESGAPVYALRLDFHPDRQGLEPVGEYLISSDPNGFEWFFGNVDEEPIHNIYRSEAALRSGDSSRVAFTPGFDASLTVDQNAFFEPGNQLVTLTIVPRQELLNADFIFHLDSETADATVISLDPGEQRGPVGERITVTPDRRNIAVMQLPLVINEPYSFSMTLRVIPGRSGGVAYRPYLGIAWLPGSSNVSSATGNTITIPVEGFGSWTWRAVGEYEWFFSGLGLQYAVSFN